MRKKRICGKKNLNYPKYWYLNGNLWKKEFKLSGNVFLFLSQTRPKVYNYP